VYPKTALLQCYCPALKCFQVCLLADPNPDFSKMKQSKTAKLLNLKFNFLKSNLNYEIFFEVGHLTTVFDRCIQCGIGYVSLILFKLAIPEATCFIGELVLVSF
jgi:hypothetical protein